MHACSATTSAEPSRSAEDWRGWEVAKLIMKRFTTDAGSRPTQPPGDRKLIGSRNLDHISDDEDVS